MEEKTKNKEPDMARDEKDLSCDCVEDSSGDEKQEEKEAEAVTLDENSTEKKEDVGSAESEANPIESLEAQINEYKSLYLRKAADFENYRKRMIREKAEAGDYAISKLISAILPILDDFDRAIAAEVDGNLESMKAFVDGVVMIKGQLEGMLSRDYGLEYYASKGEVFDPNIHEAVAKQPSSDVTVETVGEEIQKGYKLKDKVLRHAKVLVLMPEASDKKD